MTVLVCIDTEGCIARRWVHTALVTRADGKSVKPDKPLVLSHVFPMEPEMMSHPQLPHALEGFRCNPPPDTLVPGYVPPPVRALSWLPSYHPDSA